jgi:uncharacterized protein with GYD domain
MFMPKYLLQGSYTEKGLSGLIKDGGSKRREVVEQLVKGIGGRLELFYYAFGSDDVFVVLDLPSDKDAAAVSMAVNGSGALKTRLTVLVPPEEIDQAVKQTIRYRAPGQ